MHNKHHICIATTLTYNTLIYIKGQLYATRDKAKQDVILLSYMYVQQCRRKRRKGDNPDLHRSRDSTTKYCVLKEDKQRIPVCQPSFLSIFGDYIIGIHHFSNTDIFMFWYN